MDGAIFSNHYSSGVRCVLRNENGGVRMAVTKREEHAEDPMEIEILAVFRGLQLCSPLEIQSITVKSDSLLAVQAISDGEASCAQHSNLIRDIISLLKERFMSCNFIYASRHGNFVAHELAMFSKLRTFAFGEIFFFSDFILSFWRVDENPLVLFQ